MIRCYRLLIPRYFLDWIESCWSAKNKQSNTLFNIYFDCSFRTEKKTKGVINVLWWIWCRTRARFCLTPFFVAVHSTPYARIYVQQTRKELVKINLKSINQDRVRSLSYIIQCNLFIEPDISADFAIEDFLKSAICLLGYSRYYTISNESICPKSVYLSHKQNINLLKLN